MKIPTPKRLPSGAWFIQLRLGGKSIPITAQDKTACIREAQTIKVEYLTGKAPIDTSATLAEVIDAYLEAKSNVLSPSTLRGYKTYRNNRLNKYMSMPVAKIKWQQALNYEATECSAKTLANVWGLVSASLRYADIQVPKITLPQIVKRPHAYLTKEQIPIFLEAIKDTDIEAAALLALHSLRRSEILAITKDDIDLKRNVIHVRGAVVFNADNKMVRKATNKNVSSARTIPIMIPRLAHILKANADKQIYPYNPDTLRRHINNACASVGLPEVGVHGLRHSFASLAHSVGMPELECMKLGGWSDFTTMHKIYTHIDETEIHNYTNKISAFFESSK